VKFILFKLEGADFAFDASTVLRVGTLGEGRHRSVQETADAAEIVETVEGSAGRRIDLRQVLFERAHDPGAFQTVVGQVRGGMLLELFVEEVSDVIDLPVESVFPVPKSVFSKHASLFQGIFRHRGSLVPVLSMEQLAGLEELSGER
jgi:chemotaxis signal transduction protein